ncbi:MAG TPA: AI-2E family transporter [Vicinamibacterales bacterium]
MPVDHQVLQHDMSSSAADAFAGAASPERPKLKLVVFSAAMGLTALVVYLMVVGQPILLPFVIAVFSWYLINAVAMLSARIRFRGRSLPARLRVGVAIALLLLVAWLAVHLIIANVNQVMAAGPVYEKNLLRLANRGGSWLGYDQLNDVRVLLASLNINGLIRSLTLGLTAMLGSLGTIAIYTVFLLLEQHHFDAKLTALVQNPEHEALVRRILQRIGTEVQTYVWLKTIISLTTAVACYAVMKLVGLDLAEFWALVIFALNFIPYIGSWLGVIFPAFLALIQFESLTPFAVLTVALTIIQFTGGSIIEPRLMGKGLNVSPVFMLMSLAVWGTIWGVVGMFLAVPIMVVMMIVCSNVKATRPIAILLSADGVLRS